MLTGRPAFRGKVTTPLRGVAAAVVKNMTASLEVPTATSVRAVPAKLMADNRIVINNFLKRNRGGKISFTHLIGYAIVRAVADFPNMNRSFTVVDGKPAVSTPAHVNLGLAIDLPGKGGARNLVVVPIKAAETMSFTQFWAAYEQVVRKSRTGSLTAEDYAGTTISLTNPGGIGTNHSVPRLMPGQTAIIGVGALEYPAEFQGASEQTLAELGISKIITLTSTYDHRVIQGAESGEFLKRVHQLLLGEDGFYDDIFTSLRLPYEPVRWVTDLDQGRGRQCGPDLPGAGDHRRLPHPRAPDGRYRPAELPAAPAPGPGHHHPRADPVGPGPGIPGRRLQRPTPHEAARRPRGAPRRLLPHRRRRVHAHP